MSPKSPPYAAFAQRLRTALKRYELMTGRDLDQKVLAAKVGMSDATVSSWFRGRQMPKVDQLEAVAKILNANAGWLAFGDQDVVTGPDGEPLGVPARTESTGRPSRGKRER